MTKKNTQPDTTEERPVCPPAEPGSAEKPPPPRFVWVTRGARRAPETKADALKSEK